MNSAIDLETNPIMSSVKAGLPGLVTRAPASRAVANRQNKLLTGAVNSERHGPYSIASFVDWKNCDVETLKFFVVIQLINQRNVIHICVLSLVGSEVIARFDFRGNE